MEKTEIDLMEAILSGALRPGEPNRETKKSFYTTVEQYLAENDEGKKGELFNRIELLVNEKDELKNLILCPSDFCPGCWNMDYYNPSHTQKKIGEMDKRCNVHSPYLKALTMAICRCDFRLVELLVKKGSVIRAYDLMLAIASKHPRREEMIAYLFSNGAQFDTQVAEKESPLTFAYQRKDFPTFRRLLEKDVDLKKKCDLLIREQGSKFLLPNRPLGFGIESNIIFGILVDYEQAKMKKNENEIKALGIVFEMIVRYAVTRKNYQILDECVTAGMKINAGWQGDIRNGDIDARTGKTCFSKECRLLTICVMNNFYELCEILVKHGAKFEIEKHQRYIEANFKESLELYTRLAK